MKTFLRGLSLAALVASPATFAVAQQSDATDNYYSESAGDEYADNEIAQVSAAAYVGDDYVSPTAAQAPQYRTAVGNSGSSNYQAAGFRRSQAGSGYSGGCNGGCGGSCGSCSPRGNYSKLMSGQCPEVWASAEALLWFPQARTGPALASFNAPGTNALLTTAGTTTFGTELGNNLTAGGRFDVGKYLGDGNFGIGGRFWIIGDDSTSANFQGDGSTGTVSRPFFNTATGTEDAVQVASTIPSGLNAPNGFTGSITGEESLSMLAAEAYGRLTFGHGREFHTDLIGGYSYFHIGNDLSIDSDTTATLPSTGSSTTFSDRFNIDNNFNGGQIGAETILRRGRWVARSLTKVHLGNMNQRVVMAGSGSRNVPGVGIDNLEGGLLTGGFDGTYERDVFTFAPEVNLKLGYRFRDHVTFNVGYSFIYWNNVALVGDQIDRNLEFDTVGGNVNDLQIVRTGLPYSMKDRGFWVQGIDLGTTIEF